LQHLVFGSAGIVLSNHHLLMLLLSHWHELLLLLNLGNLGLWLLDYHACGWQLGHLQLLLLVHVLLVLQQLLLLQHVLLLLLLLLLLFLGRFAGHQRHFVLHITPSYSHVLPIR